MATDEIHVRAREPIDTIEPTVHGHFAEHLGRGIYPGIWVGEDGEIENDGGIRTDTVELLRELEAPVVRWPGGCFADDYHWQDGIGPRDERPRRRNLWWVQGPDMEAEGRNLEESNQFGTDEFCRFCELVGAEQYLAVNVGSGSIEEAMAWMEYVNWDGDTEWVRRRRENGREEPYEVKYWGVGNESWSCGGQYHPEEYARDYTRFMNFLGTFERGMIGDDIDQEYVAVGNSDREWNRTFLDNVSRYLPDHIALHSYVGKSGTGDGAAFDDREYYRLLAQALKMDEYVQQARDTTYSMFPEVNVAVDEWGIWHPQATHGNGLSQDSAVRDGLVAATYLDTFHHHADVVKMANLAQTVNVLQCVVKTEDGEAYPTPTYRVFDLYRPHKGATAVPVHVETGEHAVEEEDEDVPTVGASASLTDDGVYVTASNRHLDEARTVAVDVEAVEPTGATATALFAGLDADHGVTPDNADEFAPEPHDVAVTDSGVAVEVPPSSVVGVEIGR